MGRVFDHGCDSGSWNSSILQTRSISFSKILYPPGDSAWKFEVDCVLTFFSVAVNHSYSYYVIFKVLLSHDILLETRQCNAGRVVV